MVGTNLPATVEYSAAHETQPVPWKLVFVQWTLKPLRSVLRTNKGDDSAVTIDRLFASQHVTDLRLIAAIAFAGACVVILCTFAFLLTEAIWHMSHSRMYAHHLASFLVGVFTSSGPTIAVLGVILAWGYQIGSARLGVIDLFSCEISTLCRVGTVVDIADRYIASFKKLPKAEPSTHQIQQFTSTESYFPVFESGVRDLQTLEARVVINITAFYTYMKAVRDSLRTRDQVMQQVIQVAAHDQKKALQLWQGAVCNLIYMLFLGLESARHAVDDLVEFHPERTERIIVILLGELATYRFLRRRYEGTGDMREKRVALRAAEYAALIPPLLRDVEEGMELESVGQRKAGWQAAASLVPELKKRYDAAQNFTAGDLLG